MQFCDRGNWSKPYTYRSPGPIEKGALVVVKTPNYFQAGKVVKCEENYAFEPGIKYRFIYKLITTPDPYEIASAPKEIPKSFKMTAEDRKPKAPMFSLPPLKKSTQL